MVSDTWRSLGENYFSRKLCKSRKSLIRFSRNQNFRSNKRRKVLFNFVFSSSGPTMMKLRRYWSANFFHGNVNKRQCQQPWLVPRNSRSQKSWLEVDCSFGFWDRTGTWSSWRRVEGSWLKWKVKYCSGNGKCVAIILGIWQQTVIDSLLISGNIFQSIL